MTRAHRVLAGVVVAGAVIIAGIGFAGSYAAVRSLALDKGFGWFANVFPIGVDAGIVVLLALDLLLTWLRIPFPLLRQTAWLLTAATIAFNGAAAWPDKLGVGMHAIIPVLFVVSVEAARHALGRIADITADKHMEGVRVTRWLLAPAPTFRLWRRMKLWELRSYEEVIRREQDRLVYRARLRARYGAAWRRRAPVEAIMPLRLAKYGVPLAETADAGLRAAGIMIPAPATQLAPATPAPEPAPENSSATVEPGAAAAPGTVGEVVADEALFHAFRAYAREHGTLPSPQQLDLLAAGHGGTPPAETGAAEPAALELEQQQPAPGPAVEQAPGWNNERGDTAPVEFQPEFHPEFQPGAAAPYAGTPASRSSRGPGLTVHARVPAQPPAKDAEDELELFHPEPAADVEPGAEVEPAADGKARLRALFDNLAPAERSQSANRLAQQMHAEAGLSEGSARKYLGEFRRQEGRTSARS
ncbi:hypothetical protein RVR_P146 (plasmid) [Actinacidiphila reveromycinica]|uniref:DUF2637 domain-containing protein n=1 Tax=Actinacidiphila reveromycinica TaxID=659352 RepID=A0A7R6QHW8_9ACTN|nr:DUF2637 domain-containing protein [Streptomyces sp. SN-593]BBG20670.1 hypothetical protein RVR_P146 [Streptomyces sp. SN-593]